MGYWGDRVLGICANPNLRRFGSVFSHFPISPFPHLPISPSPHLPISPISPPLAPLKTPARVVDPH